MRSVNPLACQVFVKQERFALPPVHLHGVFVRSCLGLENRARLLGVTLLFLIRRAGTGGNLSRILEKDRRLNNEQCETRYRYAKC